MSNPGSAGNGDTLTRSLKACRRALFAVGFISMFVNILMLTVPLYMLQIFDRVLTSRSTETLVFLTIAAVGALIVFGVLDLLRNRVMIGIGTWLEHRLGPEAVERSVSAQLVQRGYGAQSLRDIAQVRQFLSSPAIFSLFDAPWVPIYLAVIWMLHPLLGTIALAAAVLLFALALVNEMLTRKVQRQANESWGQALRQTESALRNAHVIEAMGLMPGVLRRWLAGSRGSLELQQTTSERSGLMLATSKSLRLIVQALILGAGAYLVIQMEISPGTMIAGSIILSRALQPVEAAIGTWKQLLAARASHSRLRVFFSQPPARVAEIQLPVPAGQLTAEHVTFIPPGGTRPAVLGVSFRLDPGEILAIIGPSAAGKSSLARLIVGSWKPYSGTIRLDGADVFTWERTDFGRHVGYMPQEIELFEGTVAENIARLNEADENAVVQAAQKAGAHEMILRLADGYRTQIGEGGHTLSGGQRQRIALARALFQSPRLIVLDEPNSNLDSDGEDCLIQAIDEARNAGSTMVLVAHRPRFVSMADKVLVLRDGSTEMFGPRDQVLPQIIRPVPVTSEPPAPSLSAPGR